MELLNASVVITSFIFLTAGLALVLGVTQLIGRIRYFENYNLAGLLFCIAFLMFQLDLVFKDIHLQSSRILYFHLTLLYLLGPVTCFAYYLVIVPVDTLPGRKYLFFLPALAALVFDIYSISLPEEFRLIVVQDLFSGIDSSPTLIIKAIVIGAEIQFVAYMIYIFIKLLSTKTSGDARVMLILLILDIFFTISLSLALTLGYVLSILNLLKAAMIMTGLLILTVYFVSARYPKVLQLLMYETVKRYYERSLLEGVDIEEIELRMSNLMDKHQLYLDENLSLKSFADELGLSPHQLSQLLNQRMSTNFNSYVNQYRITDAKVLLVMEPERTVLSIAFAVGFNSKSAFYEAFSRITGKSPKDYRKEHAGE